MEVLLQGLDSSIQTKQFLEQHVWQEHVSEVFLMFHAFSLMLSIWVLYLIKF